MSRPRYLRYILALIFLGLLATAYYAYQNLPRLLNQQLAQMAQQYGVDDIKFQVLHLNADTLSVPQLWLQGIYEGHAYEATLHKLEVQYDWRMLISRRVRSMTLERLELSIAPGPSAPDAPPSVLELETLLPQNLIRQLPLQSVQIRQMQIGYLAEGMPAFTVNGHVEIADELKLQLATVLAGSEIVLSLQSSDDDQALAVELLQHNGADYFSSLSGDLRRFDRNTWEWQLQGRWDDGALLAWLRRLAETAAPPFEMAQYDNLLLEGTSELTGTVRHPNTLQLPLTSSSPELQQLAAELRFSQTLDRLDYPDLVHALTGAFNSTLTLENGQLQIAAEPFRISGQLAAAQLALPAQTQEWLRVGQLLPFSWHTDTMNVIRNDSGNWRAQLSDTDLVLGGDETQLSLETLQIGLDLAVAENPNLKTDLSMRINTRVQKQQLPPLALTLTQNGNVKQSDYTLQLSEATGSVNIHLEGEVNPGDGSGNHQLRANIPSLPAFSQQLMPLLRHFDVLQSELGVNAGSAQLDSQIKTADFTPAHWTQESDLQLNGLSGSIGEQSFTKLSVSARWSGIEKWETLRPAMITIQSVESGITLQDITVQLSLPKPTPITQPALRIEKFSAGLFGGALTLTDTASWDFSAPSNTLTLQAQQWQLADVVALQQDKNIQATGVLAGELPVTLADSRIIIEKGYLRALPPGGTIRYAASEASQSLGNSSKELALALDLLSNFQYQTLAAEVDLNREGSLLLGLSLGGRNPERFDGRQINFNINLEQNIDPLLQSLRVSDTLVEKIEHHLK